MIPVEERVCVDSTKVEQTRSFKCQLKQNPQVRVFTLIPVEEKSFV